MIYLDTSVLVPLFLPEPRSREAENGVAQEAVMVSDLAAAEFSSALSLAVRSGRLPTTAARTILAAFDAWMPAYTNPAEILGEDIAAATLLIRRFDLGLRTPDSLHIAIATRMGARLFTYDARMASAALSLGVDVVT